MDSMNRATYSVTEHPGALGSFRRIRPLCKLGRIDGTYRRRLLAISATSLLSSPLRLLERVVYGRRLERTAIPPSPIFVLGHWRSGTTHLQNLLCQDHRLGYLSAFQAIAPGFCLIGRGAIRRLLGRVVEPRHRTRPMDNVAFSLDAPQEEELALANLSPHSFAHAFVLPRQAETFFRRYVLFEDSADAARAAWVEQYMMLLRKVALADGGRRLVLKNCTNTARVPMLLDLFPDAKFIHIHRNPYDVFTSTVHLHEKLISLSQLHSVRPEHVERNVLTFYRQLMWEFLSDRSLIPSENLIEVRFEEVERDPVLVLREIYHRLGLPPFSVAEPAVRAYVASLRDYKKNDYNLETDAIAKINRQWAFAFDAWGYTMRPLRVG